MLSEKEEFFIINNSIKMEDEINQIASLVYSSRNIDKKRLIDNKKQLTRYLKREKEIKRKFIEKQKSFSTPMKAHKNVLTSIPFLKEKIDSLEKRIIDFNKSLIMTIESGKLVQFEEEDYKKMIVVLAGSKSRFTSKEVNKDMHLSKGEKEAFLSPYPLSDCLGLLDEYLEFTMRLDTIDKSILGLYSSQGKFLSNNDLSFLLISPSTRDSLKLYMKALNKKMRNN